MISCSHQRSKRLPSSEGQKKQVVLIGIDGLGSEYLKEANLPHLKKLMKEGSYTLKMKPILPLESSSNWYSIFTGKKDHGLIHLNQRPKDFHWLSTVFKTVKLQRPSQKIGAFYDWKRIEELLEGPFFDHNGFYKTGKAVAWKAGRFLSFENSSLGFVYFGQLDVAGHRHGFGSPSYMKMLKEIDDYIGHLITKIKQSKNSENTVIAVISDHGGIGKDHRTEEEYNQEFVPFILSGKGIKKNYEIEEEEIYNYDLAPTLSALLDVLPDSHWDGKVLKSAFEEAPIFDGREIFNAPPEKESFPLASSILNYGNGNVYFFNEGNFFRFKLNQAKFLSGPNSNWNFIGLSRFKNGPNEIDATSYGGDGYAYFFKGEEFIRFNISEDKISSGYPKKISNRHFNGLKKFLDGKPLDCAFYFGNDLIYFFRGEQVLAIDIKNNQIEAGFPRLIENAFSDLSKFKNGAKDIDACTNWLNGKAYFFKNNELMRIDLKTNKSDEFYPLNLK